MSLNKRSFHPLWCATLFLVYGCGGASEQTVSSSSSTTANPASSAASTSTAAAAHNYDESIDCNPQQGITPSCGFRNPEDLVVVPGGEWLIVSEMGPFMQHTPNTLSFFDIEANLRIPTNLVWATNEPRWGDPKCSAPDPAAFSPHGIDFVTLPNGRHQLLVVNHGSEAVEFFELAQPADLDPDVDWQLQWRGCAKPGNDLFMNDVAALNDGGFFVTHMWSRSTPFEEVTAKLTAGENTGWVMEWQPVSGFRKVANTDALMPNGIAVNKDNSKLFVNIYMANQTLKIDRATEQVEATLEVRQPDNVTVDAQTGELWIASHLNEPIAESCDEHKAGPCLLPFQIVKADPDTMTGEVAFKHEGEPMGFATVALSHQGRLFMGSATGDRVASVAIQ